MVRWEIVEQFIDTHVGVGQKFTSRDLAAALGVSNADASQYIQGYLTHQRGRQAHGKYVLKRAIGTRTAGAQWSVGDRVRDLRVISNGFHDDTKKKWLRAVEPDLLRIGAINPMAERRARIIIDATFDGALRVLEAAVNT